MKVTILNFIKAISLIPYPVLAAYSFFALEEVYPVPILLALEVFNVAFLRKTLHYETLEEKEVEEAGRITYIWMAISYFTLLSFRETAFKLVSFSLPCACVGVFLVWVAYKGRWKELRSSLHPSRGKRD
jgi:hypothetical protein